MVPYSHLRDYPQPLRLLVFLLFLILIIRRASFVFRDLSEGYPLLPALLNRILFDASEKKKISPWPRKKR